jgi:hypothetical protein
LARTYDSSESHLRVFDGISIYFLTGCPKEMLIIIIIIIFIIQLKSAASTILADY